MKKLLFRQYLYIYIHRGSCKFWFSSKLQYLLTYIYISAAFLCSQNVFNNCLSVCECSLFIIIIILTTKCALLYTLVHISVIVFQHIFYIKMKNDFTHLINCELTKLSNVKKKVILQYIPGLKNNHLYI